MIYFLYVKTHNITGLKYLGKTQQEKRFNRYPGSGTRWLNHLKKHGNNVTTEIIGAFDNLEDLKIAGKFWSEKWNIVESQKWANLKIEEGDGNTPELARKYANERVAKGTHNFQSKSNPIRKLLAEGKHCFQNSEWQRQNQLNRVKNGTHPLLGGEITRKSNTKRIKEGIFPFLGPSMNQKMLANGTHASQKIRTCHHCGKIGKGGGMVLHIKNHLTKSLIT